MKTALHIGIILLILAVPAVYCGLLFGGYEGVGDGNDYAALARNITTGKGFSVGHVYPLALAFKWDIPQPDNIWAPGYPVFLALLFVFLGADDTAAIMAGIFAIWLLTLSGYFLGRAVLGPTGGLLTAGFIGLGQVVMYSALEGTPETLTGALLTFSVLILVNRQRFGSVAVSAILFSFAVLTRYQIAIVGVPLAVLLVERHWRLTWVAFAALTISPWLVRNWIVLGNPLFTLQSYGEFTKGMGKFGEYYYTYRSFVPIGLLSTVIHYPFDMAKKIIGGVLFFSQAFPTRFNFLGTVPFFFALLRVGRLESAKRKLVLFGFASAVLIIALSSLDGHHDRHLLPLQVFFAIAMFIGLDFIISEFPGSRLAVALATLVVFIPTRAPYQEMKLHLTAERCAESIPAYRRVKQFVGQDKVVVSDASDAIWWYADRLSIWIPTRYDDLRLLMARRRCDFIYLAEPMKFIQKLEDDEIADFVASTARIEDFPGPGELFKVSSDEIAPENFAFHGK